MKQTLGSAGGSQRKPIPAGIASIGMLALAVGVMVSSQALAASITTTKHNLSSTGSGNASAGTGEICVFCHTPHGADTAASVPLWNRTLSAASTYTTYNTLGTSSLDGKTAPVGSVSLACLSCHDGTQALNVMVNAPGSGSTPIATGWTSANGSLDTATGKLKDTAWSKIGTDLKNDHPIGIQYAGGPKTTIPAVGTAYNSFNDADFKAASSLTINGQPVWWVDTTGGTTGREKTDMQLYTRTDQASVNLDGSAGAAISGAQPYVECASCHDPHSSNTTFLRIENTGSAVCLACHTK